MVTTQKRGQIKKNELKKFAYIFTSLPLDIRTNIKQIVV